MSRESREQELVEKLGSPSGADRHAAYEELIALGPSVLSAVHDGLGHSNWQVRRWCAMVLDRMATQESLQLLIPLLHDRHSLVRLWAVHSISCDQCKTTKDPIDAVPLLIERLKNDPSVRVRRMAAAMLANHHPDPRTFKALRDVLAKDTDEKVRLHARFGLGRR